MRAEFHFLHWRHSLLWNASTAHIHIASAPGVWSCFPGGGNLSPLSGLITRRASQPPIQGRLWSSNSFTRHASGMPPTPFLNLITKVISWQNQNAWRIRGKFLCVQHGWNLEHTAICKPYAQIKNLSLYAYLLGNRKKKMVFLGMKTGLLLFLCLLLCRAFRYC